jgi:hypothetical protein
MVWDCLTFCLAGVGRAGVPKFLEEYLILWVEEKRGAFSPLLTFVALSKTMQWPRFADGDASLFFQG